MAGRNRHRVKFRGCSEFGEFGDFGGFGEFGGFNEFKEFRVLVERGMCFWAKYVCPKCI